MLEFSKTLAAVNWKWRHFIPLVILMYLWIFVNGFSFKLQRLQTMQSCSAAGRINGPHLPSCSAVARVGKNRLQVQPLALNFSLLPCSPGPNSFLRLRCFDISVLKCNADLILQKRFFIPGYEYVRLELCSVSSYMQIDGWRPKQASLFFRQWVSSGSMGVSERKGFSQITEKIYDNVFLHYKCFIFCLQMGWYK